VLTEAAVKGQQDHLLGLKENVIIGRLIPAQVEIPGMDDILRPQPALDMGAMAPGGWLRGPAVPDTDDSTEIDVLGSEDDFDRLAQAARTYASEGEEEDDLEDIFDDDDDEEEVATTESTEPAVGVAEQTTAPAVGVAEETTEEPQG
jgi:hypothetical protein